MDARPQKRVLLADPHGFCAGVARAVTLIEDTLRRSAPPVYCLREIVHNRQVVRDLAQRGVRFVTRVEDVADGATVVFSAHGVTPEVRRTAAQRGLRVVDATCPFVQRVHADVRRYARDGYTILLIGKRDHDEVVGVTAEAPDRVLVIEGKAEAETAAVADPQRVAAVTQTTLSVEETREVMDILKRRFPGLRTPQGGSICYATQKRQEAVQALAARVDQVIVLGSANSSNSNRLVEAARAAGGDARLVSSIEDLAGSPLDAVAVLGLTSGASTPEAFVHEALRHLASRGFTRVERFAAPAAEG